MIQSVYHPNRRLSDYTGDGGYGVDLHAQFVTDFELTVWRHEVYHAKLQHVITLRLQQTRPSGYVSILFCTI